MSRATVEVHPRGKAAYDAHAHRIPDPSTANAITIPGAIEQDYVGKDYGIK
jgi:hypothetical protein